MGLFDDLRLADEVQLPDGYSGRVFQTKDFDDPYMDLYRITADGFLELNEYDTEPTGKTLFPIYGDGQGYPETRRINERWRRIPLHGMLNFYHLEKSGDWHEYNAKFTDGRLIEILAYPEAGSRSASTSTGSEASAERPNPDLATAERLERG